VIAGVRKPSTRRIELEIDAHLYAELSRLAKENGQSRRFLLEKALEHYLQFVMPSQGTVRPEIMSHFRRSTNKNYKLYKLLAK
jgi:sigma54-dependent transcription regulator